MASFRIFRWLPSWWLHVLLFVCTLVTTTVFGFALDIGFRTNRPFQSDWIWEGYVQLWHRDPDVLRGLAFSGPLLVILLTHECGHYLACRWWNVDATLPFFLPSPLTLGTFGAFIRITSPIYTRRSLFDIGASGPLAGFVMLAPFLVIGVFLSHVVPGIADHGDFIFGSPLVLRFAEWLHFPGVPIENISLHPMARAAWAGLIATSINLLPIGQLDGGHIIYSFFPGQHKWLSRVFLALLIPLAKFDLAWLGWAILLFFFGMRHPLIYDNHRPDGVRSNLGFAALAVFLVSFSLAPVRPN